MNNLLTQNNRLQAAIRRLYILCYLLKPRECAGITDILCWHHVGVCLLSKVSI